MKSKKNKNKAKEPEKKKKPEKEDKSDKKDILVVEDDEDLHLLYKDILGDQYNLKFAKDTEKAEKELNKKKPDLMILDIILPDESGDQFFSRIKQKKVFKDLKVLGITVLGDVSDYFKEIDENTDCLGKPFDSKKLKKKVDEMTS